MITLCIITYIVGAIISLFCFGAFINDKPLDLSNENEMIMVGLFTFLWPLAWSITGAFFLFLASASVLKRSHDFGYTVKQNISTYLINKKNNKLFNECQKMSKRG